MVTKQFIQFLLIDLCMFLCFHIHSTPGPFPSKLPGFGTVCGNGQALPVLLLCPIGHLLVCRHLRHAGHVASDPSENGQQ